MRKACNIDVRMRSKPRLDDLKWRIKYQDTALKLTVIKEARGWVIADRIAQDSTFSQKRHQRCQNSSIWHKYTDL